MKRMSMESARYLGGKEAAHGDDAPDEPEQRAAAGNFETRKRYSRDAGEPVGAAGDVTPLDGKQQHDEADPERCQRKIVFLEFENRNCNDNRQERWPDNGQRKCDQKRKS